jgi:hypothetical protein
VSWQVVLGSSASVNTPPGNVKVRDACKCKIPAFFLLFACLLGRIDRLYYVSVCMQPNELQARVTRKKEAELHRIHPSIPTYISIHVWQLLCDHVSVRVIELKGSIDRSIDRSIDLFACLSVCLSVVCKRKRKGKKKRAV